MATRRTRPADRDLLTPSPTLLTFGNHPAAEALLRAARTAPEAARPRRFLPETPLATDAAIADKFRSVEAELERLRLQHVTYLRSVQVDPASVPLPVSDDSRSPSPVNRVSPASTLKRARESGNFSREEVRLMKKALDPPPSSRRESPRPSACGYTAKLNPFDGVSEPFKTFIARFDNFASHYEWT